MKITAQRRATRQTKTNGIFDRRRFMLLASAGTASLGMGTIAARTASAQVDPAYIKACVFDTFGTLLDWRGSVARQVKAVADAKGGGRRLV